MASDISFYVQVFRSGIAPGRGERMAAAHDAEAYQKAKDIVPDAHGSAAISVKRGPVTSSVLEISVLARFGTVPVGWFPHD